VLHVSQISDDLYGIRDNGRISAARILVSPAGTVRVSARADELTQVDTGDLRRARFGPVVPLNVLLSHALLDLTRSCERAGAEEVVLWSNLLRVVGDDGVDRNALPLHVRLSKRVVKATVDGMVRHEWASVDGGVVRLTDVARRARDEWGARIVQAEATWPGASLRAPLEAFVSRLPLEYSHYPRGYGAADWRVTGGDGVDWRAVDRDLGADTVTSFSLLALLSQALVGFTAEYESRVPLAMLVGWYLDAAFSSGCVPLADAPSVLMIAGNGKSSLERHGAVAVDASKQVMLTPVSRMLRDVLQRRVPRASSPCCTTPGPCSSTSVNPAVSTSLRGRIEFGRSTPRTTACGSSRSLARSPRPRQC